ncbi:hypothetical protein SCALIN_C03_0079 [Candidatus Scalindua japonica]|uniref:DUF1326 domain-containing protein n=1 Tax=Candidatus Scalindua japonica TaxID=1284222 RepID=A0A286TU55_9BACT|nr:DUF1326 domain-containing protein [Candidatus Scalindua japonica]GAX59422.1 hypothetical protein SCALIN_C03_0079 [Candidatus Scalindua japonica]
MVLNKKYLWIGIFVSLFLLSLSGKVFAGTSWSIKGEYFEGCTCNPGCPCLFGSEPTHNRTCKITGVFNIHTGHYGQNILDGQTVIGITDLTAGPDENWIVFYINGDGSTSVRNKVLLDIFQHHVFGFTSVPSERTTVKYLPVHVESSAWRKKAVVEDNLILDVELLKGTGDPDKPTQIVNKSFPVWADEFDTTLNMGKASTHRYQDVGHKWNYDGRSGFSTNFHFEDNE